MRTRRALWLLFLILGLAAIGTQAAAAASLAPSRTVLTMKLTGVVDPFAASYLKAGIHKANDDGDVAALIEIDTPGGLDSSMRQIVKAILASKVPVICYTAPSGARAASAGTFIMLACPVNAMAPGTNIGAAHPVGVSGAIEQGKVTNDAAAFIRSLATRWGRNADWAEKAVRQSVSVPAEQAVAINVVDYIAPTAESLLKIVGACPGSSATSGRSRTVPTPNVCGGTLVRFKMPLGDALFHAFADPNVAFLLLNIGFLALIAWVFHPGFHVSLAVGVITMAIALAILETLPVELVGVVLLLVAAILFVLDVKAKAHGVLTAGGIAVLILGGLLLFNPSVPSARVSRPLVVVVAVGAGLFAAFVLRALLSARGQPVRTGRETMEGSIGVAATNLDPRGTVRARGETWSAESAAGKIRAGDSIRIVRVSGVRLIVEPADIPPTEGELTGPQAGREGGSS